jgi:26S proteasome regulatory subunit N8
LGWYTTGKCYKNHDIDINELFKKYVHDPVFLMVDVENNDPLNLPTEAHISIDTVGVQG